MRLLNRVVGFGDLGGDDFGCDYRRPSGCVLLRDSLFSGRFRRTSAPSASTWGCATVTLGMRLLNRVVGFRDLGGDDFGCDFGWGNYGIHDSTF